jgi:hypothetical protein
MLVSLSSLWQMPERNKLKRRIYFGSVSMISVHGQLAPLFLSHGEAEHCGRRTRQSTVAYLMAARKPTGRGQGKIYTSKTCPQ